MRCERVVLVMPFVLVRCLVWVVLVVVSLVRSVAVPVVEIVDMVVVLDHGVATVGAVFVLMSLGLEVSPPRDPVVHGAV